MRRLALVVGIAVIVAGATLAAGLCVGHWFGFGEEVPAATAESSTTLAWTQVTLPTALALARVGPVEDFRQVVEARTNLGAAEEALADAQAALANPASAVPPWGLPEMWHGYWCLEEHPQELRAAAESRGLQGPTSALDTYPYWANWAHDHTADFALVCGDVVSTFGVEATPEVRAKYEARGLEWVTRQSTLAVTQSETDLVVAQQELDLAMARHEAAVRATVHTIVMDIAGTRGSESDQVARGGLLSTEWSFCAASPDSLGAAATSLGLLPLNQSEDLFLYWRVTRPLEYARACKTAYAEQQSVVLQAIQAQLADAEWVFCDLNPDDLVEAAVSLGFLPDDPDEDRITYWWATRPDEFIRACKAAFALG